MSIQLNPFQKKAKEFLIGRGITPHDEILARVPSSVEQLNRLIQSAPRYLIAMKEVPTEERVRFLSEQFDALIRVVDSVKKGNPRLFTDGRGKSRITDAEKREVEKIARAIEKSKYGTTSEKKASANAIRSIGRNDVPGRKYRKLAFTILGALSYIKKYGENYEQNVERWTHLKALDAYSLIFKREKRTGPLTPKEGYLLYAEIVKQNPKLAPHAEEIANAQGMRKAELWRQLYEEEAKKKTKPKRKK